MARGFGWLWPALILVTGVAYQCLIHSAVMGGPRESIRIALTFLPLLVLAMWVAARARDKPLWSLILLGAGSAIYVLEHLDSRGVAAAYGLPHAAIHIALMCFFGRTLCHGQEPLITRLARRVHGTLSPELTEYTRRITYAWCIYFAAQPVISVLLFAFAPLNLWSLYINLLNLPLLAAMFIGEYVYRALRHREFPHASLVDGIRAFAQDAASHRR